MTDNEKKQIESYRKNGYGYKQISNLTNLSVNTIKSYCKRNKLMSADLQSNDNHTLYCEQCGNARDFVQTLAETSGGTIILI